MSEYALIVSAYPERPMTAIIIKDNDANASLPHETISTTECNLNNLERFIQNTNQQYDFQSVTLYGPSNYINGGPFRKIANKMAPLKFAFVGYDRSAFDEE